MYVKIPRQSCVFTTFLFNPEKRLLQMICGYKINFVKSQLSFLLADIAIITKLANWICISISSVLTASANPPNFLNLVVRNDFLYKSSLMFVKRKLVDFYWLH